MGGNCLPSGLDNSLLYESCTVTAEIGGDYFTQQLMCFFAPVNSTVFLLPLSLFACTLPRPPYVDFLATSFSPDRYPEYVQLSLSIPGGGALQGEQYLAKLRIDDDDRGRTECQ